MENWLLLRGVGTKESLWRAKFQVRKNWNESHLEHCYWNITEELEDYIYSLALAFL